MLNGSGGWQQSRGIQPDRQRDASQRKPKHGEDHHHDRRQYPGRDETDCANRRVGQPLERAPDVIVPVVRNEDSEEQPANERVDQRRQNEVGYMEIPVRREVGHGSSVLLRATEMGSPGGARMKKAGPQAPPSSGSDQYDQAVFSSMMILPLGMRISSIMSCISLDGALV